MMRVVCFLVCLLTLSSATADFGVSIGLAHNELIETTDGDTPDGMGFRVGIATKFALNDYFEFRPAVLYSTRDHRVNVFTIGFPPFFETTTDTVTIKYTYIDVPLLLQLKPLNWLGIYVGPVVAFNIDNDDDEELKSVYYLGQAGLHFDMGRVGLDIFYEKGFGGAYDGAGTEFKQMGLNLSMWFGRSNNESPYGRSGRQRKGQQRRN